MHTKLLAIFAPTACRARNKPKYKTKNVLRDRKVDRVVKDKHLLGSRHCSYIPTSGQTLILAPKLNKTNRATK